MTKPQPQPSVVLLLWGLLAAAFFSASFVLYEFISAHGGHWFWSASLRCFFMWLLLSLIIVAQNKGRFCVLAALARLFWRRVVFWCVAGAVGFAGSYGLLAFAADHAPAWVVTSTFLFTVVASLVVLYCFGQRFSGKIVFLAFVVFFGIALANIGEGLHSDGDRGAALFSMLLYGALPAFLAAFCFPIGNQLVWQASLEAQQTEDGALLASPLRKVWLLSAGSLPAWCALAPIVRPPLPSASQTFVAFLVALLAGVFGTSVFLYARSRAATPSQVAAVDATQAAEIVFALLGGVALLSTPWPSWLSVAGIVTVIAGLILFARAT